jgi:hypothetical protein
MITTVVITVIRLKASWMAMKYAMVKDLVEKEG